MKGVTTGSLSQGGVRRNCSASKDAGYPPLDGKTPEPLLQPGIGLWCRMCRIGGRLRSSDASRNGADGEIPPFLH